MASPAAQRGGCIASREFSFTHEHEFYHERTPRESSSPCPWRASFAELRRGSAVAWPRRCATTRGCAACSVASQARTCMIDWFGLGLPCGRADTRTAHPVLCLRFQASLVAVHTAHAPAPRCEKGGTRENLAPRSHLCTRGALLPPPSSRPVAHTHATPWRQTAAARRRLRLGGAACEPRRWSCPASLVSLTPVVAAVNAPLFAEHVDARNQP